MYHGANSFAKENYRETTSAGFGCIGPVPDNRGASEYGRWQSLPPADGWVPGLRFAVAKLRIKIAAGFSVESGFLS